MDGGSRGIVRKWHDGTNSPSEFWLLRVKTPSEKWLDMENSPSEFWLLMAKTPSKKWLGVENSPSDFWLNFKISIEIQ